MYKLVGAKVACSHSIATCESSSVCNRALVGSFNAMSSRKAAKKRLRLQPSEGVDEGASTIGLRQDHVKRPSRSGTMESASSTVAGTESTVIETVIL